jgi:GNAT superfamily N-acetyltransferase
MSAELKIRPARREDLGAIAALWRELGWLRWINDEDPAKVESAMVQRLQESQADDSHLALVAEDGQGRVLAYGAMHFLPYLIMPGPEAYVSELFVTADARGRGVGQKMLRHLEKLARERGCARLMLITLRDRESYQREFYKKQGWQERPVIANFVRNLMEL